MNEQIYDFFPLTVVKYKINLSEENKKQLINYILDSELKTKHIQKATNTAWLGDMKGEEFLLKKKEFLELSNLISEKTKSYTKILKLNNSNLEFFLQRSWATITRTQERIHQHSHDQSNISFAYYPLKPEGSGNIKFFAQPQNEIATGLFHQDKLKLGLIESVDIRNTPSVDLKIEEDDIIFFPSKTKHATIPNKTNNPRISISGDISIMLKDSLGHERLMPHFKNWQKL